MSGGRQTYSADAPSRIVHSLGMSIEEELFSIDVPRRRIAAAMKCKLYDTNPFNSESNLRLMFRRRALFTARSRPNWNNRSRR